MQGSLVTEECWESENLKFQEPQTDQSLTSCEDLGKSSDFYSFVMLG